MNVIIKETDFKNVIGTSFHNYKINASVNELINILCVEPIKDFDDKTKFQWNLEYYSKILNTRFYFTIYDYNEDWNSHIESATGVNDYLYITKIDWHIGGKCTKDTSLAKNYLTNKLKEFRNEG